MKLASFAAVLALSTPLASAEDYLRTRRSPSVYKRQDGGDNFNISIYHVNDIHAHLDEITTSGTDCTNPARGCYGGYARIKKTVDDGRATTNNSLFLNMGDEFQGTLFYSFYGGEKIAETMNQLDFDAFTLGNHEFDRGEEYLGEFLNNLTMPVVCANVQSENTIINSTVKPYHIFDEYKLAVVAVTTETTPSISNPDDSTIFPNPINTTQFWVDYVYANEDVERVIVMTHIGYENDIELAKNTRGVYLVLGGHSHTLLGDMEGAEGKYPTVETNLDGEEVFVVTAYRYGEYLGHIDVEYDSENKIVAYTGGPIRLTNTTAQDTDLQAQIEEWRGPFEEFAAVVLGESEVTLDQSTCQQGECLLGNFMCDAMFAARSNQSDVDACIINAGGIRATIDEGNITRGEVLTAFPFGNTLTELEFTGEDLWKVFQGVVSGVSEFNGEEVTSFVQVSSGLRLTWNPNLDPPQVINLEIGQDELRTVEFDQTYTIVTLDFLAGGGDNLWPPRTDFVSLSTQDEVLTEYIERTSPVNIQLEGRIEETEETTPVTQGSESTEGDGALAMDGSAFMGIVATLLTLSITL